MKTILSVILFSIIIQSSYSQENKISIENIYGKWKFLKIHSSKLNRVNDILNDTIKTKFPSFTTYAEDGTFRFQSCYSYTGFYKIGPENLITEYKRSDKELDTTGEITYLDEKYLLVYYYDEEFPVTYFYKKIETPPNRR